MNWIHEKQNDYAKGIFKPEKQPFVFKQFQPVWMRDAWTLTNNKILYNYKTAKIKYT
jgi:hypothetical protein